MAEKKSRRIQRFAAAGWLLLACIVLCPALARAATFTVTSIADAVDASQGNGVCATATGVCTLRAAIQEANALAGADTIILPAGTYTLARGSGDDTATTGDLDITQNLTITGAGARTTIVSGGTGANLDRVFEIRNNSTASLSGITVTNGDISSSNNGGGIFVDSSSVLTLTDAAVTNCKAKIGGGIINNGILTLVRVTVSGNAATAGTGGGIQSAGGSPLNTLTNVTISGNSATGDGGGAEFDAATMVNVTISGNTTGGAGAGLNRRGGQPHTLKNTIIANNTGSTQCNGTPTSLGNNLSGDASCSFVAGGDLQNTNPLLGALANNGGPTDTLALLAGSPAIDAGTATGAPPTDQRGVARPQGVAYDMGAYEGGGYLVSGTIFEDVNYGGGGGRNWATASGNGGSARPTARVELFDGAGAFVTATVTNAAGSYTFSPLTAGNYSVRVVSSSVTSSRTGYVAGLLPVQTYGTNASSGTAADVTNQVGGYDPATQDGANAAAGWILNAGTGVFSGSGSGKAHAFAPVTVGSTNVTGVNFGFSFDAIVNVNNSGQGSLRQFINNANTLGGDASLAQAGLTAGIENAVFMISNGTAAAGLRAANNYFIGGVATIAPSSALPAISTPMKLDGEKQPGAGLSPVLELNGTNAGAANGLQITGGGSFVYALAINRFSQAGVLLATNGGNAISKCYIGTNAAGTAPAPNGQQGILISGSAGNMIGGAGAGTGNLISGNGTVGVAISGAVTGNAVLGNAIYGNTGLGIDLGSNGVTPNDGVMTAGQPNQYMDFPVFTSAILNGTTLTVAGYVGSAPNQTAFANARVEIFKSDLDPSGYGEGRSYLGFLTADANGNASGSLTVSGLAGGDRITGTATDGSNNTSEFGPNFAVLGTADLALVKIDNPDPAASGGDLIYTLQITNSGPSTATSVTLTDTLPAGVTLQSATPSQGSCSGTATVTCSLGAIVSGGSATVEILVVTSGTGILTNSANVTASEIDPVPGNNTATATTDVVVGSVVDIPLSLYRRVHGSLDSIVTGGSLRKNNQGAAACNVAASSTATLSGIPVTATVTGAYLYWAGTGATVDTQITLDGSSLTADRTFQAREIQGMTNYDYFGGFKDVTAQVQAKRNGNYTFAGLTVDNGSQYCSASVVVAGWSLFVIYQDPSLSAKTLVLYDGFDYGRNSSSSYLLSGIHVASPPEGKTSFLLWEGDASLGTSAEFLSINGSKLSDGLNPVNNVYNSTINSLGINSSYGMDLDTFNVSSYVTGGSTSLSTTVSTGADQVILNAVLLQVTTNIINGTVFEDVNYGGGAGRDLAAAVAGAPGFTVPRPGAVVELYDAGGNFLRSTTTNGGGEFSFAGLPDGDYTLRAVNGSVTSSRPGATGSERGVQTYRTTAGTGTALPVINEVGGVNPAGQDGAANVTSANLSTFTAQSTSPVRISGAISVIDNDFGFNFDTVVNVNDTGQGSLRQVLANANALANAGLAQSGRTAGIDNAVWMISNGTAAAGLRPTNNYFLGGLATISTLSALPGISDPMILDGTTQPGWTAGQIIKLDGAAAGGGSSGLAVSGGASLIKGLVIDGFGTAGISLSGAGGTVVSDNVIHANNRGIYANAAGDRFFRNVVYGNSGAGGEGFYLDSGAAGVRIYHNTIHGNAASGISQAGGAATVRNNLITGNGGTGLSTSGGTLDESYNGITDAGTTPANGGGRSNVALSPTDLNINPLYVSAATGNFLLTECTSPAINQGLDLGAEQPDMNGATAGLWNNNAPDLGAFESGSSCSPTLAIIKQAWDLNGTAPLTSLTAPVGSELVFLIYVRNPTAGPVTDLRINDALDEAAFQYLAGSLVRTSAATPPSDTATDLDIFAATAPATGTAASDGVDGDIASAQNSGGLPDVDRITIGAVAGQANAGLTINGRTTFALRFRVKIK